MVYNCSTATSNCIQTNMTNSDHLTVQWMAVLKIINHYVGCRKNISIFNNENLNLAYYMTKTK